ncbi:hypothetical protein [Roseibium sp. MMSF_3544]|uniref:hypothetical protein n=1 Tax=unclassified Roseibium TaxID=2629323 RepID=UPI00273DC55A|nr:hypothetical protein [Roseibium sp. MMSF_3544]
MINLAGEEKNETFELFALSDETKKIALKSRILLKSEQALPGSDRVVGAGT